MMKLMRCSRELLLNQEEKMPDPILPDAICSLACLMTGATQLAEGGASRQWLVDHGLADRLDIGNCIVPTEKGKQVWHELLAAFEEGV